MSEVLRGWNPNSKLKGDYSREVETAAATTFAGRFAGTSAEVFPLSKARHADTVGASKLVAQRELQSILQKAADVLLLLAVGCVVSWFFAGATQATVASTLWSCMAIAVMTLVADRATTQIGGLGLTTRKTRFMQAAKAWSYGLAGYLFCAFAFKATPELSRAFLGVLYGVGLVAFSSWRALGAPAIARLSQRLGTINSAAIVIGDTSRIGVHQFSGEIANGENDAFLISLHPTCSDSEWPSERQRVLNEVCRVLHSSSEAALYLCSTGLSMARLEGLCEALAILPVGTYIVPDPATAGLAHCRTFAIGNRIAFELRRAPLNRWQVIGKRLVDIVFGALALVALSPIMLAAAIAIRLDSKGPIFFRQERTGQSGEIFCIFKFRSMYVMEDGPSIQQAGRNDPRVTRVGRFLRASSIDELPQLLNVLKGEMSLVGPRPHAVAHDKHYTKEIANYELRQHVKPGITGWAQVNGLRGETSDIELMRRRIDFDIWYALNASLLLDFEIMARTALTIWTHRNAY